MATLDSNPLSVPASVFGLRRDSVAFLLLAMVLTALAAGTGWGIRGQYGHESGAMLAGAMASLTLVMLFVPHGSSLFAARSAAMMTAAIGIGGSMTYGQTVGLTHDHELVGNWEALRWGMIGLFIKGGLWIGFGGVFIGMGLSRKQYRPLELFVLMLALIGLMFVGIWLLNTPLDAATKTLPKLYFSDNWAFEPDGELKPRVEVWGGYLVTLSTLIAYVGVVRGDSLAARMGLIAFVAGGLGFSGGQSLQAMHAWNAEEFKTGAFAAFSDYTQYFNWWNIMETTFGMIWGAGMAFGLWCNQRLISAEANEDEVSLSPPWEITLCAVHICLLMTAEFVFLPAIGPWNVQIYIQFGLVMATLPIVAAVGGRIAPYLVVLPIVIAPIGGKTFRGTSLELEAPEYGWAWTVLLTLPILISLLAAVLLAWKSLQGQRASQFAGVAVLFSSWILFGLNTVFFDYAWPWDEWTGRTPNQFVFLVSVVCITVVAFASIVRRQPDSSV